ncbi:hypothetical protein COCVIDRAFT_20515 [Bipolaris victoriae FI3]|uniref:Heterokaryon incompatibility domain-containing protein n=1 Tax=Bipolaris victoriae (strain FI3) TaxID=930091 RepID=W7E3E6_BIPV3|nr:hypothetical protein COCVIDRAFT_20515 [Bipolaris victoriae FI3]
MGLVYGSASEVLVWLGEADVYSNIMVEAQKVFASSVPELSSVERYPASDDNTADERPLFSLWDFEATRWYEKALKNEKLLYLTTEYFALESLGGDATEYLHAIFKDRPAPFVMLKLIVDCADRYFSRPSFRRIWVIQEVVMAQIDRNSARRVTVFSGQSQVQWNELVAFALLLGTTVLKTQFQNIDFFNHSWLILSGRSLTLVMENYRRWQLSRSHVSLSPHDKNSRGSDTSSSHSFQRSVQNQNLRSYLQHDPADRAPIAHSTRSKKLRERSLTAIHDLSYKDATNGTYPISRDTVTFNATSALNMSPPSEIVSPLDYLIAVDMTRDDPLLQEAPLWVINIFTSNERFRDSFSAKYGVYNASGGRPAIVRPTDLPFSLSLQGVRIARIKNVLAPQPLQDRTSADLSYYMVIKPGRKPFMVSKRESTDLQKLYMESQARAKSHTSFPTF